MNSCTFKLKGESLAALPSGALWWPSRRLLCVSDLHLGKSERAARRSGMMLPPYETRDTLARLQKDLTATAPAAVICLGDSFDDLAAAESLSREEAQWLSALVGGRRWIWVEGNHDPGPLPFGGLQVAEHREGALTFRHIARSGAIGELSGHYHPKARVVLRGQTITRPCFLLDQNRLIMPAYGTYTGGLYSHTPALARLMEPKAVAILCGQTPCAVPMPRR